MHYLFWNCLWSKLKDFENCALSIPSYAVLKHISQTIWTAVVSCKVQETDVEAQNRQRAAVGFSDCQNQEITTDVVKQ